jgi:TolA-binding protein
MTLEERILLYPDLPAEERRAVEAAVVGQPELEAMLDEVRELRSLFEEAELGEAVQPGAEVLSHYVVTGGLPAKGADPVADRLRAAIETDPELRAEYEAMQARMAQLADESEPADVQFRRLSGRSQASEEFALEKTLPPPPAARPRTTRPAAPAKDRAATPAGRHRVMEGAFRRVAVALVLVVAVSYAALFAAGPSMLTEAQRLADLSEVPEYAGFRLRGPGGQADPTLEAYGEAVQALEDAHRSTLGLFPHYDEAALEDAATRLEALIRDTPGGQALALDARYVLAKVRLYQGDEDAARRQLRTVLQREGPSAPDAERLLEALDARP